jgi:hypothetical protein
LLRTSLRGPRKKFVPGKLIEIASAIVPPSFPSKPPKFYTCNTCTSQVHTSGMCKTRESPPLGPLKREQARFYEKLIFLRSFQLCQHTTPDVSIVQTFGPAASTLPGEAFSTPDPGIVPADLQYARYFSGCKGLDMTTWKCPTLFALE